MALARAAIAAALTALVCACATAPTAELTDITGSWSAHDATGVGSDYADYFDAALVQQPSGAVGGAGAVNLCGGCRSWNEYAVEWSGAFINGELTMHGTPERPTMRRPAVTFRGRVTDAGIEGRLYRSDGDDGVPYLMRQVENATPP